MYIASIFYAFLNGSTYDEIEGQKYSEVKMFLFQAQDGPVAESFSSLLLSELYSRYKLPFPGCLYRYLIPMNYEPCAIII
jgi:hypothetical protein